MLAYLALLSRVKIWLPYLWSCNKDYTSCLFLFHVTSSLSSIVINHSLHIDNITWLIMLFGENSDSLESSFSLRLKAQIHLLLLAISDITVGVFYTWRSVAFTACDPCHPCVKLPSCIVHGLVALISLSFMKRLVFLYILTVPRTPSTLKTDETWILN